jgi:ornithine carbamoyltransferase
MKKDFLSMKDLDIREIIMLFKTARAMKQHPIKPLLKHKNLVMLFQKPSTRTMVSFNVGMNHLGGHTQYLNWQNIQLGRGEIIADTARTLSRYADGIMARLYSHKDMVELAGKASVPVINGLTDLLHPCQALSDMFTIHEKLDRLKGVKLCFIGDGSSNVCHSLMYASDKLGLYMSIACPKKYRPDHKITIETEDSVVIHDDAERALKDADVVCTDTFVSMGQERLKGLSMKLRALKPYRLDSEKMRMAKSDALVMHCLPAHRGQEITAEVLDGPQSVVWDQAENRLHVQKALLAMML